MILTIWQLVALRPESFPVGRPPTKSQLRLRTAENKETGGSPFAPCEIRRSINRKIHNSPLA